MQTTIQENPIQSLEDFLKQSKENLKIIREIKEKLKENYRDFYREIEEPILRAKENFDIFSEWIKISEDIDSKLEKTISREYDCDLIKELDEVFKVIFYPGEIIVKKKIVKKKIKNVYDKIFSKKDIGNVFENAIFFKEMNLENKEYLINKINNLLNFLNENVEKHEIEQLEGNITNRKLIMTLKRVSDLIYRIFVNKLKNDVIPNFDNNDQVEQHKAFNYANAFLIALSMFFEILEDQNLVDIIKNSQEKKRPKINFEQDIDLFVNNFKETTKTIRKNDFNPKNIEEIEQLLEELNISLNFEVRNLINYIKPL